MTLFIATQKNASTQLSYKKLHHLKKPDNKAFRQKNNFGEWVVAAIFELAASWFQAITAKVITKNKSCLGQCFQSLYRRFSFNTTIRILVGQVANSVWFRSLFSVD